MRSRAVYGVLVLLTVVVGLGVRHSLTGAPAKHLGVALYGVMMLWLVKCVWPRMSVWRAGLVAVGVCWGIEALQLTPLPAAVNARLAWMRLVLGEHFAWSDLLTYTLGVLVACVAVVGVSRLRGSAQRERTMPEANKVTPPRE